MPAGANPSPALPHLSISTPVGGNLLPAPSRPSILMPAGGNLLHPCTPQFWHWWEGISHLHPHNSFQHWWDLDCLMPLLVTSKTSGSYPTTGFCTRHPPSLSTTISGYQNLFQYENGGRTFLPHWIVSSMWQGGVAPHPACPHTCR